MYCMIHIFVVFESVLNLNGKLLQILIVFLIILDCFFNDLGSFFSKFLDPLLE
jgi:hypothetical protein